MWTRAIVALILASSLGGQQGEPKRVERAAPEDGAHCSWPMPTQELVPRALALVLPPHGPLPQAQPPTVPYWPPRPRKISNATVTLGLPTAARFGTSVAAIGDLDDDGVPDLAVGAPGDGFGSVRILFLKRDRSVRAWSRIDAPPKVWAGGHGWAVCALGDLDGDGVEDIAASSPLACQVYVHFLRSDGSVKSSVDFAQVIDPPYAPGVTDSYGEALASPGDLDGDGVNDVILVCGRGIDGNDPRFYTVFLRADGNVKSYRRTASLTSGTAAAALGDLDGDGVSEIAVSNPLRTHFLNADGTVRFSVFTPGFTSTSCVAGVGDLDGDGVPDWALGEWTANQDRGRYRLMRLNSVGRALAHSVVELRGPEGRSYLVERGDAFGASLALLGNLDGLGLPEIAIGAPGVDDVGTSTGAVWIAALF